MSETETKTLADIAREAYEHPSPVHDGFRDPWGDVADAVIEAFVKTTEGVPSELMFRAGELLNECEARGGDDAGNPARVAAAAQAVRAAAIWRESQLSERRSSSLEGMVEHLIPALTRVMNPGPMAVHHHHPDAPTVPGPVGVVRPLRPEPSPLVTIEPEAE